jgi:hypothetical protein
MTVRARVIRGRLVVDEPTDLPEGTEVELVSEQDDRARHADLAALLAEMKAERGTAGAEEEAWARAVLGL